eukprot:9483213-Pyramimonas_sp.AAC.1
MELNVSAGCSTLLGILFSAGCSTLLAGPRASPLEVRENARATQRTAARSCAALRVAESRPSGNEDERHYDAVLNKYMHAHAHAHAAFHMGVMRIYTYSCIYIYRKTFRTCDNTSGLMSPGRCYGRNLRESQGLKLPH